MSGPKVFCFLTSLLFLSLLPHPSSAQRGYEPVRQNAGEILLNNNGYRQVLLVLGGGMGNVKYRDDGTAPFAYSGPSIMPSFAVKVHGDRKRDLTFSSNTLVGALKRTVIKGISLDAYNISNTSSIKMEWIVNQLKIGVAATNFLDITVNPSYENASVGVSDFMGADFSIRGEMPLSHIFKGAFWENKSCHGEITLMPIAKVLRPGFSYIDNYSAGESVMTTILDGYEWRTQPFASLGYDFGVDIYTDQFSKISISYLWDFYRFAPWKSNEDSYDGPAPFRHSSHILSIDFYINLKVKNKIEQ